MKNFIKCFKNCVKSMDFWSMTIMVWTITGMPAMILFSTRELFVDPAKYETDMELCAFAVTMALIGAVAEWAIIITEKELKNK